MPIWNKHKHLCGCQHGKYFNRIEMIINHKGFTYSDILEFSQKECSIKNKRTSGWRIVMAMFFVCIII